jgi:hypothetical protein
LLAVKPHGVGLINALFPAFTKVQVIERNADLLSRGFADIADQVMILLLAVSKR